MKRQYINNFHYLRVPVIVALWVICFILCAQHSFAYDLIVDKAPYQIQVDSTRFNVSGRVIDETGQPLPGATIFISNSKWAANTNNQGIFKITGIPAGNYELLVRMMGFVTVTKVFNIADRSITINVALNPDAIALNEARITAKPDGNRARYLSTFTEIFLGRSDNARKSKILNSDVLRFNYDKATGTLTARSTDFIKVNNAALGYNVSFLLNSFSFNQNDQIFGYDGKVYFEELQGDEQKQKAWKKNRLSVYYGSMQHFFKALFAGTTEAEGFKVYKIADSELGQSSNYNISASARTRATNVARTVIDRANLKPVKPDSLFKTAGMSKVLKLPLLVKDGDTTRFYICYIRDRESSGFLNSGMHLNIPVPNAQISSVYQVVPGNIVLNKDGSLLPEKSLLLQGYWAWPRVADMLPTEIEGLLEAENVNALANPLNKPAPVEKIHVQMDRPWYLTGDTAWMKVYVVDAYNKPSADSKVCFVELIDKNKRIVKNLRLPLNTGIAWGEIALSDSLVKEGAYMLRVYTNNTQKNGNSFFYKSIRLADLSPASAELKNIAPIQNHSAITDSLQVQFFPEGGKMVTDLNVRVAIKISAFGDPVNNVAGYIANEEGSHIAKFETNKSGISTFNLKPLKQGKYWAVITLSNAHEKRFALPQPQSAGVNMVVKQNDEDIIVYLNAANLNSQTPLNLIVKTNDRITYQAEKLLASTADSIVISKTELPAGILQLYLHTGGNQVAERIIYNNSNRQLNIKLMPGKAVYKPHDKVDINIAVIDADNRPVSGNFSVSVNNEADIAVDDANEKNILKSLLMGSIKNGGREIRFDLAKPKADTQRELDDLLLTLNAQNGVKQELAQQPSPHLPQDTSSALRGQVLTAKGKSAAPSIVGLFFPLGGPALTTISDNNGRFTFNSIPIKRGDPLYIVAKDKSKDLIVSVDKYESPVIPDEIMADTLITNDIYFNFIARRIEELKSNNILGTALKEVLIKDKKKTEPAMKELVQQRSSNIGGRPDQVLTFIDLLDCASSTLGGCLALKLNGVTLMMNDTTHRPKLVARGRSTEPMTVFVDGVERPDALATLSTSGIASVEVLKGSNAAAYGFKSGHGVVVITTKGGDLDYWGYEQEHYVPGSTKVAAVQRYRFENGFDIPNDYYSPDYTKIQSTVIDKWRPTIYWNPNVVTGTDGKAQLSYFTNSAPGTYRVTVEGIDGNGRIARQVFKYTVSN